MKIDNDLINLFYFCDMIENIQIVLIVATQVAIP